MSRWDELWEGENYQPTSYWWEQDIKAVGDKLQKRNESLIIQHNQIREAHIKDIQKLEEIQKIINEAINLNYVLTKAQEVLDK